MIAVANNMHDGLFRFFFFYMNSFMQTITMVISHKISSFLTKIAYEISFFFPWYKLLGFVSLGVWLNDRKFMSDVSIEMKTVTSTSYAEIKKKTIMFYVFFEVAYYWGTIRVKIYSNISNINALNSKLEFKYHVFNEYLWYFSCMYFYSSIKSVLYNKLCFNCNRFLTLYGTIEFCVL